MGTGRRRAAAALATIAMALALAACAGKGSASDDGRLLVVAGAYPLAEIARNVGGSDVRVRDLTPAGAEPHDLELTTDQVDAIEDAGVVLYVGNGFQPAVAKAAGRATGRAVDLLAGDDAADPHVWLDPVAMERAVDRVRDVLARADAAHRAAYEARAASYRTAVDGVDAAYRDGLADCERRTLVTAHAAFGRLAARYDLEQVAISGIAPDVEPDPKRLAQIADRVRADGVTTVFTETLVSPRVARSLAREAGVATAVLDPIESRTVGSDYVRQMQANLTALRKALGCR